MVLRGVRRLARRTTRGRMPARRRLARLLAGGGRAHIVVRFRPLRSCTLPLQAIGAVSFYIDTIEQSPSYARRLFYQR